MYEVDLIEKSCTCLIFFYTGSCKHLAACEILSGSMSSNKMHIRYRRKKKVNKTYSDGEDVEEASNYELDSSQHSPASHNSVASHHLPHHSPANHHSVASNHSPASNHSVTSHHSVASHVATRTTSVKTVKRIKNF